MHAQLPEPLSASTILRLRATKALARLCECAGLSESLLLPSVLVPTSHELA